MSLALPIRDVTRGQGIASCLPLRSRPWHQAARLSWSGLLGRAAADPSLGRVTSQTGRMVTFQSGAYTHPSHNGTYGTESAPVLKCSQVLALACRRAIVSGQKSRPVDELSVGRNY